MNDLDFGNFLKSLPKTETHLHIEGALPWELLNKKDPKGSQKSLPLERQNIDMIILSSLNRY